MSPSAAPPYVLRLLGAAYFFAFGSVGVQVAFLTTALEGLGFAAALIGSMWALRSGITILAPAFLGTLADRLGSDRTLATVSLLGAALSLGLLVETTSAAVALALFGLYGLVGTASVSLLDGLVLTALGPDKHRYGHVRVMGGVGFGVWALLSTQAAERGLLPPGQGLALALASGLMVLAAGAVALCPRLERPAVRSLGDVRHHLARAPGLLGLGLLSVLHWAGHGAYTAFIAPLAAARGAGQTEVGLALVTSIVVETAVMRASSRLLVRFGARPLLVVVCLAATLRWSLLALTDDALSFILLQGLHGVTFGLFYPTVVTRVAEATPPEVRQGAQGLFSSLFFGVGGALGMWLAGRAYEAGGAPATWGAMAALAVASLLVALFGRRWLVR